MQSPSWAANWFAASQETPRISRNPKVHYRTHKSPPPVPQQAPRMFYNKYIKCLYMFRALCAYHQEVKTVLYNIWYRHTLQVAVRFAG